MDAFTAAQTTELVSRIGTKKATMRLDKLFINSVMVGPLLGFGCAIVLSVNASPWYVENAPGLIRWIGALVFPIGLVMIVLTGADLFTSNIMFATTALLHRRITVVDLLKSWVVSFSGNLAGCLFFDAIILYYGGVYETPVYKQAVFTFATHKMVQPPWHQIFLRAIGANWLVCMAVYLSISAREIVSKIAAIWWPTMTFVALALDHVIANMIFIPTAILYGHPEINTSFYIWKSLIPTLLGNLIGGGIMVAIPYWYLYLFQEETEVVFNLGAVHSGVAENAGPTPLSPPSIRHVLLGREVNESHPASQLPHAEAGFQSAVSRELSQDKYGKKRDAEKDEEKSDSEKTNVS